MAEIHRQSVEYRCPDCGWRALQEYWSSADVRSVYLVLGLEPCRREGGESRWRSLLEDRRLYSYRPEIPPLPETLRLLLTGESERIGPPASFASALRPMEAGGLVAEIRVLWSKVEPTDYRSEVDEQVDEPVPVELQQYIDGALITTRVLHDAAIPQRFHREAIYHPRLDTIFIPAKQVYNGNQAGYYHDLLHEIVHATRKRGPFLREEPIAELGSLLLLNHFGILSRRMAVLGTAYLRQYTPQIDDQTVLKAVDAVNAILGRGESD